MFFNVKKILSGRKLFEWGVYTIYLGAGCVAFASNPEVRFAVATEKNIGARKMFIESTQLELDEKNQIIKASGRVTVYLNDNEKISILRANKLTYDQKKDTVVASGEVAFVTPTQEIFFSDQLILNEHFKHLVGEQLKVLLVDDARLASQSGRKNPQGILELEKTAYTPCKACCLEKEKSPFWQMKADKVVHNENTKTISYQNVKLELLGVPIFYTPYFWHPDPSIKRKSGILTPIYSSSKNFGLLVGIPYFYVIDDNTDLTLTPVYTTKQGPLLMGEFRHAFPVGFFGLQGSITKTKKINQTFNPNHLKPIRKERWHFYSTSRVELTPNQLLTFDVQRASDTTYLRSYSVLNKAPHTVRSKNLTSSMNWENYQDRSYTTVQSYIYQTDFRQTTPLVAPYAWHRYESDPWSNGLILALDANAYGLFRQKQMIGHGATNAERLILNPQLELPLQTDNGQLLSLSGGALTRLYNIRKYQRDLKTPTFSGNKAEFNPQVAGSWRYPFISIVKNIKWILEPIIKIFSTFGHHKTRSIPNEDSLYPHVNDFNILNSNRFDGYDRIDLGHRIAYGINNELYDQKNNKVALFLGHSLHYKRPREGFIKDTGQRNATSDLVGRLFFKPSTWWNGQLRFSQPTTLKKTRTTEFSVEFGKPILKVNASYIYFSPPSTYDGKGISQVTYKLISDFLARWSVGVGQTIDLKRQNLASRALSQHVHLDYHNDCFVMSTILYKTSYRDRDLRPDTGIMLQLSFKTLGSFNIGSGAGYSSNPDRYFENTHSVH